MYPQMPRPRLAMKARARLIDVSAPVPRSMTEDRLLCPAVIGSKNSCYQERNIESAARMQELQQRQFYK